MDRWTQYLLESHPESTLKNWAKRLRFFRFFRAYGGHANDGDSLIVAYKYQNTESLAEFFHFLGVPLITHTERPPQPEPGVAYRGDEYSRFPSLIPDTTWIEQPGHTQILGRKVFVWCSQQKIQISLSQGYDVVEENVTSAEALERILEMTPLERIEPPIDNKNCVCPKYYPQYFG